MRVSPRHWLVQVAFFPNRPESYDFPRQVTLCGLFWRVVLKALIVLAALFAVAGYLYAWRSDWKGMAAFHGMIVVIVGMAILQEEIKDRIARRREVVLADAQIKAMPTKPRYFREAIWGIKNKVCPVIYLTDEEG